jgi:hypothetical protein
VQEAARLVHCPGTLLSPRSFAILELGTDCTIFSDHRHDPPGHEGGRCRVVFADGPHDLHVTGWDANEVSGAAGMRTSIYGEADSVLRVRVEAEDATTGRRVTYRFTGRGSGGDGGDPLCRAPATRGG